jgi:inorganic pyrophosphatase
MDTSRWKSILVPREVYEEIKELSKAEGRTIGGQLRLVFDWYKKAQGESGDVRTPRGRTRGNTEKAK